MYLYLYPLLPPSCRPQVIDRLLSKVNTLSTRAPDAVSSILSSRSHSQCPGGHRHLDISPPIQNLENRVSYFSIHPPHLVSTTHLLSFLCFPSLSMALPETWVVLVIFYSFLSFATSVPITMNGKDMLGFRFRPSFSLSSALCRISPLLFNLTATLVLA